MEAALLSFSNSSSYRTGFSLSSHYNGQDETQKQKSQQKTQDACLAFVEALRSIIVVSEEKTKQHDPSSSSTTTTTIDMKNEQMVTTDEETVGPEWLVSKCSSLLSSSSMNGVMSTEQLSLAVLSACKKPTEEECQSSLFDVLGEGEAEMEFLFSIVPHIQPISQISEQVIKNITSEGESHHQASHEPDYLELERNRLLDEYKSAAYYASITKAEAEAITGHSGNTNTTHSVARQSDKQIIKNAKKAAKVAAEKKRQALAAGVYIPGEVEDHKFGRNIQEELFLQGMGGLGMANATSEEIDAMRSNLLPEGSKVYHEKKGLPKGTIREHDERSEIVIIPAAIKDKKKLHKRIPIEGNMSSNLAKAFAGTTSLNPMQSQVFEAAFHSQENILVCAPTGAGKTNVAMLTLVAHFRDKGILHDNSTSSENDPYAAYAHIPVEGGRATKQNNDGPASSNVGKKVVYIAPMKALAQEVVEKFNSKLKALKIITRELTGDMQLTKAEADSADIIVTTPEKWDVVTRKGGDGSLSESCGLLIIDEVHLLADDRGSVIESVVARTHRFVESRQQQVRIVGLSATLPNYEDVAEFLKVSSDKGLFYFGPEHRPVPLRQSFIGVTEKNRFKREKVMNDICYDTVVDSLKRGYQVMVFVHSRKMTGETCTALREKASKQSELESRFVTKGTERWGSAYSKYSDRASKSRNKEVSTHFENGMGIHHAGMLRSDRKLSEQMFNDGAIKVLCCTATLAWGINLPAHTVVIKGTEVYNPEKGGIVNLSILDVMQIFGRAGRPQFDTSGEATLITSHESLSHYLNLLVKAVPIESNFIKQLPDHLNAEVVGRTVCNIQEAVEWLTYTYLYVRMVRNPLAYGISGDQKDDDPMLRNHCSTLIKNASKLLDERRMLRYNEESGNLGVTDLGRVASHFYVSNESVATFNNEIYVNSFPSDADLLVLVCSACEFENIRVRQEEMEELDSLRQKCPVTSELIIEDFIGKCCVLLQAYISNAKVKSFTLISDINYISQNAGRIARALFEMCLNKGASMAAFKLLRIAKSVDRRLWWFNTPLRQFSEEKIPSNVFNAIESRTDESDSFSSLLNLLEMAPQEVGQFIHWKKGGSLTKKLIRCLPYIEIECNVQPITRNILNFQVELTPSFDWNSRYMGGMLGFWLWVEDDEHSRIYHHDHITFSRLSHPDSLEITMKIPAFDPLPSQYFIRLVSDSWVGCDLVLPVSFQHVLLPEMEMPFTNLMDLTPLPKSVLHNKKYEALYPKFETFNPIQTQLFHVLYHTNTPVLLGAPTGSGKTIVAEIALLRMKRMDPKSKCVYIAPLKSLARERLKEWRSKFSSLKWSVLELSGDTSYDSNSIQRADILVCTPEKWDLITRGWRDPHKKQFVSQVKLLIMDEIHLLGEERGAVLEAIVSRTRFISKQVTSESESEGEMTRILGLSTALANPTDLADWMGINIEAYDATKNRGLYNFRPSVRPIPMEVHIQGYPGRHYCPRMASMNKPCYAAIKDHSPRQPVIIFVASRRQTRLTALDLISYAAGEDNPGCFLGCDDAYIESVARTVNDENLRHTLTFGVGLHHAGIASKDRELVETLFLNGDIQVLVATATLAWGVNLPAHLVIVKGTEFFDGKTSRYVDYPVTDVLQMMGRAGRPQFDNKGVAVVMVSEEKRNFYKKFLYSPFPVESCLKQKLCETLNAEIAIGTIKNIGDALGYLDWTFFARRTKMNPTFYGAESGSDEDVDKYFLKTVNETTEKLEEHECILINKNTLGEDYEIEPTLIGKAACNFYLQYRTPLQMRNGCRDVRSFIAKQLELSGNNKKKDNTSSGEKSYWMPSKIEVKAASKLLSALSQLHEFDELPVRHNEENLNQSLSETLPWEVHGDNDTFLDPHTKCFLLLQAYIVRAKLPISDYINDTISVIDQVPRLLAAMQYLHVSDDSVENSLSSFELFCLFSRIRQSLHSRIMIGENPLKQIPGIPRDGVHRLKSKYNVVSLRQIREMNKTDTFHMLRDIIMRKRVDDALNFIYAIPQVQIMNKLRIKNEVDKSTGKSIGTLHLELNVESVPIRKNNRKTKRHSSPENLVVALGTPYGRALLCQASIRVPEVKRSIKKEIHLRFDWNVANAGGGSDGGKVILRILYENVLGADIEEMISLR